MDKLLKAAVTAAFKGKIKVEKSYFDTPFINIKSH